MPLQLACHDGLSLLHRAVQSGCSVTLATVLGWGEEAGSSWRCDLAGPMGLTPLHLAAILPDSSASRQAVLLLLSRCQPGAQAWEGCCTTDGQTPAAFHQAAAAARSSEAAAAAAAAAAVKEAELLSQLHKLLLQAAAIPATGGAPGADAAAGGAAAGVLPAPQQAQQPRADHQAAPWQSQQQQQQQQRQDPPAAAAATPAAAPPDMQPVTPRKNPGCLCAPGCPCALLDRCDCQLYEAFQLPTRLPALQCPALAEGGQLA